MIDGTIELALDTIRKGKQALVFVSSRASAEKTAEDISEKTGIFLPEISKRVLKVVSSPTKQCRRLSHCIKKGIAFHHAGIVSKQKELIEEEFRKGRIKIICATPTLSMGLSLPAFRVIMKNLKRYSGRWGMNWIPVLEYYQMTGRAGRPEFEPYGEAVSIAKNDVERKEIYERYILGVPEDIYSKLAVEPVFRTYLLSLIATNIIKSRKDAVDFFSKTFWAFQFRDMDKLKMIIDKMLKLLEEYEFIKICGNSVVSFDFAFADELDKNKNAIIKATLLGQRVSQLYLDPFTAHHLINCLRNCKGGVTAFSFLQMVSNTLEMFPLLYP
jgi:helicase